MGWSVRISPPPPSCCIGFCRSFQSTNTDHGNKATAKISGTCATATQPPISRSQMPTSWFLLNSSCRKLTELSGFDAVSLLELPKPNSAGTHFIDQVRRRRRRKAITDREHFLQKERHPATLFECSPSSSHLSHPSPNCSSEH